MNLKLVGFGGTKILGVFRPHQTFGPMEWVEARARELSPCGNSESHAPKSGFSRICDRSYIVCIPIVSFEYGTRFYNVKIPVLYVRCVSCIIYGSCARVCLIVIVMGCERSSRAA